MILETQTPQPNYSSAPSPHPSSPPSDTQPRHHHARSVVSFLRLLCSGFSCCGPEGLVEAERRRVLVCEPGRVDLPGKVRAR
jgi:hypothetical protein